MKKSIVYILITGLLCACSFSKGVKKDLVTGLYYNYNGFKIENVIACNIYHEVLTSNNLPERSVLLLVFKNIHGYVVENGLVSMGCSLEVSDIEGNILLSYDDFYKNSENVTEEKAKDIQVRVTLANPIVANKTYLVKASLFDKKNDKNRVNVEMNVNVTPYAVKVNHSEKVLSFDRIWFGSQVNELAENKVKYGDEVAIMPKLIKGFKVENNCIYPAYEVTAINKDGHIIHKYSEKVSDGFKLDDVILQEYEPENVIEGLPIIINYENEFKAGESYTINARIYDLKNSESEIKLNMDIEVI